MEDRELREACRILADAVLDLIDGAGGDDQECDRASDICEAILALPDTRRPAIELAPHEAARESWFAREERADG